MSSFPVASPNFSYNLVPGRKWPLLGSYKLCVCVCYFFLKTSLKEEVVPIKISMCKISCQ